MSQHPLSQFLLSLPQKYGFRYTEGAKQELIQNLFVSLVGTPDLLHLLFDKQPTSPEWSLRDLQGAVAGSEYTEAARGKPCGHIFRSGETLYRCKTCSSDSTCALCARCFNASDHEDHQVYISLPSSHSGCCDCGDPEAWNRPVDCSIHSAHLAPSSANQDSTAQPQLPDEIVEHVKQTISICIDYMIDVWSCAPEQLRLAKTVKSVLEDEKLSRLSPQVYGGPDPANKAGKDPEFALVLWNDEKHTHDDVTEIVARSCKKARSWGRERAKTIDLVGRDVLMYSTDVAKLVLAAGPIEQQKLAVTIRSARDHVREEMCATIIDWFADICGCRIGNDPHILRSTICDEFVNPWKVGSPARFDSVAQQGIFDHDLEDQQYEQRYHSISVELLPTVTRNLQVNIQGDTAFLTQAPETAAATPQDDQMDLDGGADDDEAATQDSEATVLDQAGAHDAVVLIGPDTPIPSLTTTAQAHVPIPPGYWLEKPKEYADRSAEPPRENFWKRVRLDFFILFDLRMWKNLRINIREILISTVIVLPEYKRILGLRLASVYPVLAELHLIADREPDHTILHLTVQMLTTPSISKEVVQRGNFLTNCMAIIYTFLTTRQVGYPSDVNLTGTLAIDPGVAFNRRAFQFSSDLRLLVGIDGIKDMIRQEPRYLLQFLDLAKIHQGVCSAVRAVGEHVEYEVETWMNMSAIMSEITRLCRLFGEPFRLKSAEDLPSLYDAIRVAAGVTIINSIGSERRRFENNEIKQQIHFKNVNPFEFEDPTSGSYRIVEFAVDKQAVSCYHPLHYIVSWLVSECKSTSDVQAIKNLLYFTPESLKELPIRNKRAPLYPAEFLPEEYVLSFFDFPIRVCAFLAQVRANMWVRNGLSLRHQVQNYKGVRSRDVTYHRDLFLVQTAFVVCDPATILITILDRFDLLTWAQGDYSSRTTRDDTQSIDIAESMIHLLIGVLCNRLDLIKANDEEHLKESTKIEIIHALCYKPLSYNDLKKHLSERAKDEDDHEVLTALADFKPPDGLSDTGSFTLKPKYFEELDPYLLDLSRNQREEAEGLYQKFMAKHTGKDAANIVFEPTFRSLEGTIFKDLPNLTKTPVFAQMIFYLLQYCMVPALAPDAQTTKIEQLFQFILHLTLIAVLLDDSQEDAMSESPHGSFCQYALTHKADKAISVNTIAGLLRRSMELEHLKSSAARIKNILKHLSKKLPAEYDAWNSGLKLPEAEDDAAIESSEENARDLKKKQALKRQAQVMASFKQQQSSFLQNQIDWDDDEDELDDEMQDVHDQQKVAEYPSGVCILCQEATDDDKLFGTFAFISNSRAFHKTPTGPKDNLGWAKEIVQSPASLDREFSDRPFGFAKNNTQVVTRVLSNGTESKKIRNGVSEGFSWKDTKQYAVSTGCGHIMHHSCFAVYMSATATRQRNQVARCHPESLDRKEFLCPLCKALANAFLPIIWKPQVLSYPGVLGKEQRSLADYTDGPDSEHLRDAAVTFRHGKDWSENNTFFQKFAVDNLVSPLVSDLEAGSSGAAKDEVRIWPAPPVSLNIIEDEPPLPFNLIAGLNAQTAILSPRSDAEIIAAEAVDLRNIVRVYDQLTGSLQKNKLTKHERTDTYDCSNGYDTKGHWPLQFIESYGATITSVEMGQRGVEALEGKTLLSTISSQTLTHLRVLANSIMSMATLKSLQREPPGDTTKPADMRSDFNKLCISQLSTLFMGASPEYHPFNIFKLDAFNALASFTLCTIPAYDIDIKSVMKMMYIVEITKVIVKFTRNRDLLDSIAASITDNTDDFSGSGLSAFICCILQTQEWANPSLKKQTYALYVLVQSYALVFLRKCIILMHTRYGIDFPVNPLDSAVPETTRLSQLLLLPSLDSLITEALESRHVSSLLVFCEFHTNPVNLLHPTIPELVGLPDTFDSLLEEALKFKCPTTGNAITDPAICLLCGEIFCSQAQCCETRTEAAGIVGGCYQHRKR
jgi:E3 ubiquitin-protein ligase UBR1